MQVPNRVEIKNNHEPKVQKVQAKHWIRNRGLAHLYLSVPLTNPSSDSTPKDMRSKLNLKYKEVSLLLLDQPT
ncbi:hypothetical protein H4Q26_003930 [Puccinia striiformis f. sp. tritici PST-130]|nr:hypothetical protein H4Q26_003930 [Puccinia striiformis f. sp. tritici PST-130]